jgi:hypothetical protein
MQSGHPKGWPFCVWIAFLQLRRKSGPAEFRVCYDVAASKTIGAVGGK